MLPHAQVLSQTDFIYILITKKKYVKAPKMEPHRSNVFLGMFETI